jgi:hypothetical protein
MANGVARLARRLSLGMRALDALRSQARTDPEMAAYLSRAGLAKDLVAGSGGDADSETPPIAPALARTFALH